MPAVTIKDQFHYLALSLKYWKKSLLIVWLIILKLIIFYVRISMGSLEAAPPYTISQN